MNSPNPPAPQQDASLKALLDTRPGGLFSRRRVGLAGIALLLIGGASLLVFRGGDEAAAPQYKTEPVGTGSLVVKVSATGNLQPINQVDVGSELSGIVEAVLVDINDPVKKGQILARLDVAKLQDQIARSRAALASAEARVAQADATVLETRARLNRLQDVFRLSGGKVPSPSELETAEASLARAMADRTSARAAVAESRAALSSDETNLTKASIRSPIDGVVLARKVEPGQTVAASFQAPVLFTLAEDLTQMELQVDVDEADVGQVKLGQKARFSVDAWPGRDYDAVVTRVDFGSQVKDGVVSYLTVLEVGNDDLSLRPGMTGTAEITTLTRDNALLVPNAALRFSPATTETVQKKSGGAGLVGMMMPRPPRQTPKAKTDKNGSSSQVWVLRDGQAVPLAVKTGASNGRVTEITGGELRAGMEVITEAMGKQP